MDQARTALRAADDHEHAAEAEILLARAHWEHGRRDAADTHLAHAEELAGGGAPSDAKAHVLAVAGRLRLLGGDSEEGLRIAGDAMAIAEALSLDELRAHSLGTIGLAKERLGDPTCIDDLEASYELALAVNSPIASHAANNLGVVRWNQGDVESWRALISDSRRLAERFGDTTSIRWGDGQLIIEEYSSGLWDEALSGADQFIADCEAGRPHYLESLARAARSAIRLARGDPAGHSTTSPYACPWS